MNAPAMTVKQVYRRLSAYLRGNYGLFGMGLLGALVFAAANASVAWLMKPFLDKTFFEKDPGMIIWVPLGLVVMFLIRGLGEYTQAYYMGHVGRRIIKQLRAQLFDRLLQLPISFFDRSSSATMLSRLTYNTEQVATVVTDTATTAIRELLTIVFYTAALFWYQAKLALVVFIVGPLIGWLLGKINRKFRLYSQRIQDSVADVMSVAKEALDAPRLIKVFNAQRYEREQFEIANENNRRASMKLLRTRGMANPVIQLVGAMALAGVLYVATSEVYRGQLDISSFFGFIVALIGMMQPLRSLMNVSGPFQQGIAAGASLFEILDQPMEADTGTHQVSRVRGEVEYRDVTYRYETGVRPALNGVSLQIRAGETVAFVGRSGSGKSTLVNLLPRFYDLAEGSLLIDGRDVREYSLHTLREQIALVSQDVVLFDDTISNNIAFGRTATPEAIREAARAAHVLEFVDKQPQGMETMVGERGVMLSGGQKQRISIARALLKDAPILILDEATSALDTESERAIQEALDQLMQNRTTLVIAHRLSTIENADRIVVMDAGRMVEMGTHAELLAQDGIYAALHRMQFNA